MRSKRKLKKGKVISFFFFFHNDSFNQLYISYLHSIVTKVTSDRQNPQTVFGAWHEVLILIRMPGHNTNEIGHKRGYLTLEYSRIAANNIGLIYIGIVVLGND